MERVEIPAYTDRWMMGDRFGEVVGRNQRNMGSYPPGEVVKVRLDRSGKTVNVPAADCRWL